MNPYIQTFAAVLTGGLSGAVISMLFNRNVELRKTVSYLSDRAQQIQAMNSGLRITSPRMWKNMDDAINALTKIETWDEDNSRCPFLEAHFKIVPLYKILDYWPWRIEFTHEHQKRQLTLPYTLQEKIKAPERHYYIVRVALP